MPDFTIEIHQQCSSYNQKQMDIGGYVQTGLFNERAYPQCTYPAYKFGKRTVNFGGRKFPVECKHILQAQESICGWHSMFDESQEKDGVFPRCGEPTELVRVAV